MFATGIEGSCPIDRERARMDRFDKRGHDEHWKRDFRELVDELGISLLRYGPPVHRVFLGVDRFDWDFAHEALGRDTDRWLR